MMKNVKWMTRKEIQDELENVYGCAVYDDEPIQDLRECLIECRGGENEKS
jgi:phosphoglycerate-specific signal transduction histidine kinase